MFNWPHNISCHILCINYKGEQQHLCKRQNISKYLSNSLKFISSVKSQQTSHAFGCYTLKAKVISIIFHGEKGKFIKAKTKEQYNKNHWPIFLISIKSPMRQTEKLL